MISSRPYTVLCRNSGKSNAFSRKIFYFFLRPHFSSKFQPEVPINGEPSLFLKRVMLFCMFFRFCSVFFCDSSQRFRKTRVEALKFWLPQYSTNRPPHQLSVLIRFAMNQRLHKNSIDAVYIIDIKSHQNKAFTNLPQLIILYLLICIGPTQALAKGFKHVLSRSTYKLLPIYPLSERLCSLSCPCLLIDTVQIMRAVLRNRPGNQCDFIERRPIGFAIEIVPCRIHNFLKLLVSV